MTSIKRVQRFTVTTGIYNLNGTEYYTLGTAILSPSGYGNSASLQVDAPLARYCILNTSVAFNPNKSFITVSESGHSGSTNENFNVRIYSGSGYPNSQTTSFNSVQISQRGNWPVSSYGGGLPSNPSVSIEIVEFE